MSRSTTIFRNLVTQEEVQVESLKRSHHKSGKKNKTSTYTKTEKLNEEKLDKIVIAHLFEKTVKHQRMF